MARICHITSVHPWKDTRIFLKMCRSLAQMGHDVTLVALEQDMPIPTTSVDGVRVVGVSRAGVRGRLGRATKGAARVISQALALHPQIAHLHDPELIPWIPLLRARGIQVIFDAHEDFVAQNASRAWTRGWRRLPILAIAKTLQVIVNLSASQILTATETIALAHPKGRTTVINNYPIEGELQPPQENPLPLSQRPARAIYVGGMNRIRGLAEVIAAAGECVALEGLDLVGRFESPAFKTELEVLPGWQKVTVHGQCDRDQVAALLSQARFGIVTFHPLPNHIDAKPNKLFEYMSAGLPVLHSDFLLWHTLSRAPARGLAVDPTSAPQIAEAMAALLTHPELDAMGARARAAIRDEFHWRAEALRLAQVIARMTGGDIPATAG